MQKLLLLLVVVVATISNVALGQQLKYIPASGLNRTELEKIIEENKKLGVMISADSYPTSEYEEDYGFIVLSKGENAFVVFNYNCESYILLVHKILPAINGSALYPYGRILFPVSFGLNVPGLTLDQIEKKFEVSVFHLTPKSLAGCMTMLTD